MAGDPQIAVLAFGVETYDSPAWKKVSASVDAIDDILDVFRGIGCVATMVKDPSTIDLAQLGPFIARNLQASGDGPPPDALIVMWAGHAEMVGDRLRLILHDTTSADDGTKDLFDIAIQAAKTGARDVLLLIDVCYAGGGLADALQGFTVAIESGAAGRKLWWGVVGSAQQWEEARNGLFSGAVRDLLVRGPAPDLVDPSWDVRNRYVDAASFIATLGEVWATSPETQELQEIAPLVSPTRRARFIPNPLWRADAVAVVVDEVVAVDGPRLTASSLEGEWFTGRVASMRALCRWLHTDAQPPGMGVITGGPGTGKSAIVRRLVTLSDAGQRAHLAASPGGLPPADQDPGERSLVVVQARGHTADTMRDRLADGLGMNHAVRDVNELIDVLGRRDVADRPAIVVDGLDEAGFQARTIAREILGPLARVTRVVVGTREVPGPPGEPSLLGLLEAPIVDLDRLTGEDLDDVRRYIAGRLTDSDARMDPAAVSNHLVDSVGCSFLLARIETSRLRQRPVDTTSPGWQGNIAGSVGQALEWDLDGVARP